MNIFVNGADKGNVFTGVTVPVYPCVCFYGDNRTVSLNSVFTFDGVKFDISKGISVKADSTDATGRSVSSSSSVKGHCLVPVPISKKSAFEFKITKEV